MIGLSSVNTLIFNLKKIMKPKKYQAGGNTGSAKRPWIEVQDRTIDGRKHSAKNGGKMPPKKSNRGR